MILITLLGCASDPATGSLTQSVQESFAECNANEITFLANKHAFMPAFATCGSNNFLDFAWSPDGHDLYFQLGMSQKILHADEDQKTTDVVPIPTPIGTAAWVTSKRLVAAVPPDPAVGDNAPLRLAIYDTSPPMVYTVDLPKGLSKPTDLTRGRDPAEVLMSGLLTEGAERRVYRMHTQSGYLDEPFPWLGAVDTFTYSPAADRVVAGRGDTVTLYDATSGATLGAWSPATRGAIQPKGRWLMLEHPGKPVSIFRPPGWDDMSKEQKAAQEAQVQGFQDRLPSDIATETVPPMLSFVDTTSGKRWLLDSVQGSSFEWYETTDFWGSFVSWGFEGRQYRRNVLLGDFADRLHAADVGLAFSGLRAFGEADGATFRPASAL